MRIDEYKYLIIIAIIIKHKLEALRLTWKPFWLTDSGPKRPADHKMHALRPTGVKGEKGRCMYVRT